jgi:hypothetical protein
MKSSLLSRLCIPLLAAALLVCRAIAQVPAGYLDVTTLGADLTGVTDSTAALQAAINQGRDQNLAVWLPGGTYRISDRLLVDQPDNDANFPVVLTGSTVDPQNRATLVLAENSPGFNNPNQRKVVLHFINRTVNNAAFNGFNETGGTDLYNQAVIGVDFKILAGNPGAVALRMQGAEGCAIQDIHIDLTEGGHTGIWGIPASGGSTHKVSVTGGAIGLDTRRSDNLGGGGSQPQPVITGSSFIGQSEYAVRATTRGSLVMVGCRIERNQPGPAIWLKNHWVGQPFDASLQLVDCVIEHAAHSSLNTVIEMDGAGRSFLMENCHVSNAERVWHVDAAANPAGWMHFKRLAVHVLPAARGWGQPAETIYQNGVPTGDVLVDSTSGVAPPADLQSRHQWHADFPTWESPGVVNVKTLGALGDGVTDDWAVLQNAVNSHEKLFFPKGQYRVSKTLDLLPNSKLIGIHHKFSAIHALSSVSQRFGGATVETGDKPIVRTADSASADTILAFLQIRRAYPLAQHNPTPPGNYSLEWRCAGTSLTRQIELESRPDTNVRPDFIAKIFYGYNTDESAAPDYNPINPNHPQDDFLPGDWAWPCAEPNLQIRGNGGGRWFNTWFHGRQGLRANTPFLRAEGTNQPLQFYHLHMQQQDSVNHAEFIAARNVTIYGTKGEIKGSQVYFEACDNIRHFGHSGLSSPDPARNPPYLFRFVNCTNFLIAGIADTINEGDSMWVGGAFDRWIHANLLTWQPVLDTHESRPQVVVPSAHRPILYQRGNPVHGTISGTPAALPPVMRIELPAGGTNQVHGQPIAFRGSAIDLLDGNISASATWTSSLGGLVGTGAAPVIDHLAVGVHVITFSATNSGSRSGSAQISIEIVPPPSIPSNTFTNASPINSAINNSGNWSGGLPTGVEKTGWIDLAGNFTLSSGGTGVVLNNYFVRQNRGIVRENGNITLRGGFWTVEGGELGNTTGSLTVGGTNATETHVFTMRGGRVHSESRMTVNTGSPFELISGTLTGNEWLIANGIVRLKGGSATFTGTGARLQTGSTSQLEITGGTHAFRTLRLQDGGPLLLGGDAAISFTTWDISTTGTWAVNFTGGSPSLTIEGQTQAWYEARYAAGRLLKQGSNAAPFADVFVVSGSTLTLKPPPPNSPPGVSILTPNNGSTFTAGATVSFTATATDPEDGDLGMTAEWLSSIDGPLGTGPSLITTSLAPGNHEITLTATDLGGLSATAIIQVTIGSLYDSWLDFHEIPPGNPGFDTDSDGVADLLEYAMGGDPNDPASAPRLTCRPEGNNLKVTFQRIADPTLIYQVWASNDLVDWGLSPIWASTGTSNIAGEVLVSEPANQTRRFMRLVVLR